MREDRGRRLMAELVESDADVLAFAQERLSLLDERSNERPSVIERRPRTRDVLVEGERDLGARLELATQHDERAEDEAT